jgi:hypothetical protein
MGQRLEAMRVFLDLTRNLRLNKTLPLCPSPEDENDGEGEPQGRAVEADANEIDFDFGCRFRNLGY